MTLCTALAAQAQIPGEKCAPEVANNLTFYFEEVTDDEVVSANKCPNAGFRCELPEEDGDQTPLLLDHDCDPTGATACQVQVRVPLLFPGNEENISDPAGPFYGYFVRWFSTPTAPDCATFSCPDMLSVCGQEGLGGSPLIDTDRAVMTVTRSVTCDQAEADFLISLTAWACIAAFGCDEHLDVNNVNLGGDAVRKKMGCPEEPVPQTCPHDASCESCVGGGLGVGGGGVGAGGPGGAGGPTTGNGAYLYYAAGGVGHPGFPGAAGWTPTLGRYWSHSYAARLVEEADGTVWLLTEHGTFREFGNPDGGGVYETLAPSDEYRTLTATGTGWELRALDGTVTAFDSAGRWLSTTDRNLNAIATGSYDALTGELDEVMFHDGRLELFDYYPSGDPDEGKLETITEVGVDGLTRVWTYRWTGDDLTRIERPDGTAVVYTYGDPDYPGYLTLIELEGTDGVSRRVERGHAYDEFGNAVKSWRGAESFDDPQAVDRWELIFDDPANPTETRVRDPLYPLSDEAVYTLERDPASRTPRVVSISGDCPTCATGPNATMEYGNPDHPLLPTAVVDGNGNATTFTYTGAGQVATRTEADGIPGLQRTTTWTYEEPAFPALVASIARPSVDGTAGGRLTTIDRDANGNETLRTITGVEGGTWQLPDGPVAGASAFSVESETSPNPAGQPLYIDPDTASYGTDDRTELTYDSARGDLIPLTRTDPLVGTTTFVHDDFNRRTHVTDPNGVTTVTEYDALDRVTKIIQEGPDPDSTADDLITVYEYDVYSDLVRVVLPRGNLIEYDHEDHTGRLIEVARWDAGKTEGERVLYTLDPAGNRIQETHQRWDPGTNDWRQPADATTEYHYDTRCRLDRIVYPDGTATEYAYDCNGNLERLWDANHDSLNQTNPPTASYTYDALDRLTAVTRPWAGDGGGDSVTTYDYDLQDHLVSVTDAELNTTVYTYSDRDLLVHEDSPVSGETTHTYNGHGELLTTTDARPITVTRTVDAAGRVQRLDYPTDTLDTDYDYGDENPGLVPFSRGRLTAITRDGHTVAYEYDRFGRATRDGELTLAYDGNGNRTQITYPGNVTATYGHDFADREETLSVSVDGGPDQTVVSNAAYLASGPLTLLGFGTGVTETRLFDQRYFPQSIALEAAEDRTWTYSNDALGNVTDIVSTRACAGDLLLANDTVTDTRVEDSCAAIEAGPAYTVDTGADVTFRAATRVVLKDGFSVKNGASFVAATEPSLSGDVTRSYAYQDVDYFLTDATGPWGAKTWEYDKIGNRLTETDGDGTDTYDYTANGAGGNTALLESIALPTLGSRDFQYSPAGHQTQVAAGANVVDFDYDDASRLELVTRSTDPPTSTPFSYDGRSFLRHAGDLSATTGTVEPLYDSTGLLHGLLRQPSTADPQTRYLIFHLAGRPVAQLALETGQPERWWYLTTDHLGTPLVATDGLGEELWENRFEPFGRDMDQGLPWSALESEMFLRFPGQWEAQVWQQATMGAEVAYNLYRWYQPVPGRYASADPAGLSGGLNLFTYAGSRPLFFFDPNGLAYFAKRPLRPWPWLGPASCNPGFSDDLNNTELSHEQLFFEDGKSPSNVGFFSDGGLKEEPNPRGYRCRSRHYNDCIMRKAAASVGTPRPYCLLGRPGKPKYNCQDWADDVRNEYHRLAKDPKIREQCCAEEDP